MLQSLSIKNFILIDELNIEFKNGLTVITGESGSGKSILLEAILFCLGGKFSSNIIKTGQNYSSVSISFFPSQEIKRTLIDFDIEIDEELILKRIQTSLNKKKFLTNDQLVTQKTLEMISNILFEVHSQNTQTILTNSEAHIRILDDYANLNELTKDLSKIFKDWQNIKKQIREIENEEANISKQCDYLSFIIEELTKADVKINEEDKLIEIRQELQNRNKQIKILEEILSYLENHEIDNIFSKTIKIITRNNNLNNEFDKLLNILDESFNNIEEARNILHEKLNNFDKAKYNLEEIEDRLFEIRALAKKYLVSSNDLPNFLLDQELELKNLNNKITNKKLLDKELINIENEYLKLAKFLSSKRREYAKDLELKVQKELVCLKMEKAIFKIEISDHTNEEAKIKGLDQVYFTASINPGTPINLINKIASGGELSRFMLALKTVLFDKTTKSTIIFDEIDTGIGGAVADSVGNKLKNLSKINQVIVITHQPQVACKADQHLLISKNQAEGTTSLKLKDLNYLDRQYELARMISGKIITKTALDAAKELLDL